MPTSKAKSNTSKPSKPSGDSDKRLRRSVARDIATANRGAAHYDQTSDRDEAYLALYATVTGNRSFTIAELAKRKINPFYGGSNKASDGGALVRAIKAGNITVTGAGLAVLTDEAFARGKASVKRLTA